MAVDFNNFYPDLETSVISACRNDKPSLLRRLLQEGRTAYSADGAGKQPIHWAAEASSKECLKILVETAKCEVNSLTHDSSTPLHLACSNLLPPSGLRDENVETKVIDTIHFLLSHNADCNAKRDDWTTPLHLAARRRSLKVVKWLIRKGADTGAKDMDGQTPLLNAVDRLDVSLLSEQDQPAHFLDETDGDNEVAIVDYFASKMKEREELYSQDDMGFTALTLSIVRRRWRCATTIINHVSDKRRLVNIPLNYRRTSHMPAETSNCLHLLLSETADESPPAQFDFKLFRTLLNCGADVNHFNYDGHGSVPLTCCLESFYSTQHRDAFSELLPLTTVDWNKKEPCALDTCGLTICFTGHPLNRALQLRMCREVIKILESNLPMSSPWSGSSQTNCCRTINNFVSVPGTSLLRSTCRFTTYGQFAVAFMLTSGRDYERPSNLVTILKLLLWKGHPFNPPARTDEVNPLVAYLTSPIQLNNKVEEAVLKLMQNSGAHLRDCDVDHVLLQARVHRLVACINQGIIQTHVLMSKFLSNGVPGVILSHMTAARLFVLVQALPDKKNIIRKLMVDIEEGTGEPMVNDFGAKCVARCDEVHAVEKLSTLACKSIRENILLTGRPLTDEVFEKITIPEPLHDLVRLDAGEILRILRESGYSEAAL